MTAFLLFQSPAITVKNPGPDTKGLGFTPGSGAYVNFKKKH